MAQQIAVTDAIHRELGAVVAPSMAKRPWGQPRLVIPAPLERPHVVAAVLTIAHRVLRGWDGGVGRARSRSWWSPSRRDRCRPCGAPPDRALVAPMTLTRRTLQGGAEMYGNVLLLELRRRRAPRRGPRGGRAGVAAAGAAVIAATVPRDRWRSPHRPRRAPARFRPDHTGSSRRGQPDLRAIGPVIGRRLPTRCIATRVGGRLRPVWSGRRGFQDAVSPGPAREPAWQQVLPRVRHDAGSRGLPVEAPLP